MPNRVLRDWTASEKMDKLSQGAEVFFTRLIMKADDYGLYYGNPKLLNSALFPLREYDNSQVLKWLMECVKAGIVHKYTVDGKDYIQILGFDQRLRLMKSKFPAPPKFEEFHEPSNDCQMTDKCRPETKRNETEEETEVEGESETKAHSANSRAEFSKPDRITKGKEKQNAISRGAGRARKYCTDSPLAKQDVFEAIFSDERYLSDLQIAHNGKDLKQAFEECWIYHSQKPSPPEQLWQWKQKLNTWLTIKKPDNANPKNKQSTADLAQSFANRVMQANSGS